MSWLNTAFCCLVRKLCAIGPSLRMVCIGHGSSRFFRLRGSTQHFNELNLQLWQTCDSTKFLVKFNGNRLRRLTFPPLNSLQTNHSLED